MLQAEINLQQLLDWGQLDFTLYDETFAGRVQSTQRHYYCVNDLHPTANCTYAPADHLPSFFLSPWPVTEIHKLFNSQARNVSHHIPCRYAHICRNCSGGWHPSSACYRNPYEMALPYVHYHTSQSFNYLKKQCN